MAGKPHKEKFYEKTMLDIARGISLIPQAKTNISRHYPPIQNNNYLVGEVSASYRVPELRPNFDDPRDLGAIYSAILEGRLTIYSDDPSIDKIVIHTNRTNGASPKGIITSVKESVLKFEFETEGDTLTAIKAADENQNEPFSIEF